MRSLPSSYICDGSIGLWLDPSWFWGNMVNTHEYVKTQTYTSEIGTFFETFVMEEGEFLPIYF